MKTEKISALIKTYLELKDNRIKDRVEGSDLLRVLQEEGDLLKEANKEAKTLLLEVKKK